MRTRKQASWTVPWSILAMMVTMKRGGGEGGAGGNQKTMVQAFCMFTSPSHNHHVTETSSASSFEKRIRAVTSSTPRNEARSAHCRGCEFSLNLALGAEVVDKLVERQSGLGVVSASAGRQVSGKGVQWNRRQAPRQRATAFLPLFAEDPGWLDALRGAQIEDGLPRPGPSKKMSGLSGLRSPEDQRISENTALKEWMGENGVWVFDKSDWGVAPHSLSVAVDTVDENENETAGRGMISNREIKEGDELFALPINLLLTKDAAQKEFGADVITEELSEYIAIALLLVAERAKGEKSFWKPYLDVLPTVEDVYPTYLWTEEDIALLNGSPVIATTDSMRRKLELEYATVEKDLLDKFPEILPQVVQTYEAFQWAFAILFSRAIRLGGLSTGEAVALVPYADLFNHNPFANSYIDARQTGFFTKTDEVAVYADRSYKKMEQVYISYGPKSNADLLLLYGFSLDRNPYNSVDVTISLDEADELYEKKKRFLEDAGLPPTKSFPLYNDRYPDELLQYLRLIQLNKEQLLDRRLVDLDFDRKQTDVNELMVLDSLVDACNAAILGYPTTEEDDSKIMADPGMFRALSKTQRMAVKHRRQEKRILRRTIAAVSKAKENLRLPLGL